jgi:Raf kinase inhibitor-like YbhB/YbcL family protein
MAEQVMAIKSSAFKDMGNIPAKYTDDGNGSNPPLIFENVPVNAKTLAIIMEDPDAPAGTFDHWLVFNIPGATKEIKEGGVPSGAMTGKNSTGQSNYCPPGPPPGKPHRYIFKLYALDGSLFLMEGDDKFRMMSAMEGRIIAQATLTGIYKR